MGVVLLSALFWAGGAPHLCAAESNQNDQPSQAVTNGLDEGVTVRVNGVPILTSLVDSTVAARVPKVTGHGVVSDERIRFHRDQVIRELVIRQLMLQAAHEAGVQISEADITAQEEALQARFSDQASYQQAVGSQGLNKEQIRKGLREHLMGEKLAGRVMDKVTTPSEEQLRAYYDANLDKFKIPAQAEVSYLMLTVDPSATKEIWDAAKDRMAQFQERITDADSFAAVRAEIADDDSINAVDLGRVHQGQAGIGEVDKTAFSQDPQTVSDPVWTLYGYALVWVAERVDARQLSFEGLNRDLFEKEWLVARRKDARDAWVTDLVREADLKFAE
jgi:parvulin-like peptidyl-prolyl isomerase